MECIAESQQNKTVSNYTDSEDSESDLDDSWIEQIEKEEKLYHTFYKETNETIKIVYMYIDNKNKIYHIKKNTIELNDNILDKVSLIFLLKKHRVHNNKKHRLISILQYNIDLAPQELSSYLRNDEKFNFLSIQSNLNDIKWDDSINLFKDLNSLHVIFYEIPKIKRNETKKIIIKSKRKLKRKTTRKKT